MVKSTILKRTPPRRSKLSNRRGKLELLTPIRSLFSRVKRNHIPILGKRRRDEEAFEYGHLDPIIDTPSPLHQHPSPILSPQSVALQNSDNSSSPVFSDAVIVSTLPDVPFCCHEDLMSMDCSRLLGVAKALNDRLPHALQLDLEDELDVDELRRWVEEIVGIRQKVTDAPKKIAKRRVSLDDDDVFVTPPTSPLARRSAPFSPFGLTPMLGKVVEEDEGEDSPMRVDSRPPKRRRISSGAQMDYTPTKAIEPAMDLDTRFVTMRKHRELTSPDRISLSSTA